MARRLRQPSAGDGVTRVTIQTTPLTFLRDRKRGEFVGGTRGPRQEGARRCRHVRHGVTLVRRTCSTPSRSGGDSRLRPLQALVVCAGGTCDRLRSRAVGGGYARRGCFLGYRDRALDRGDDSSPRLQRRVPTFFNLLAGGNFLAGGVGPDSHQTLHQRLSQTIVGGTSACFRFRNIGCVVS